ncbi:MAG: hypothetical protein Q7R41_05200 [Phycisphaerales bacterium]|nr:hypothetical protein [Phycisphaerales bacterium]
MRQVRTKLSAAYWQYILGTATIAAYVGRLARRREFFDVIP